MKLANNVLHLVFPGQIELFTHVPVLRNFVEHLKRKNFNVCAVYLLDSQVCISIELFLKNKIN
jgi:GPN-loop GTPase